MQNSDDQWDFYACSIHDKPHSNMVNLSLFDVAPIDGLSVFYAIEVALRFPHPDHGMTTDEEYDALCGIEDALERALTKDLRYIGRQTGDGKRTFYFYGTPKADISALVDRIGQDFPEYKTSTFHFEDADWRTYFDDFYPNAMGLNEIANRSVYVNLEKSGDDLSIPRTVDHFCIFQNAKHAKEFEATLKDQGFTVQVTKKGVLKKTYELLVQRSDAPHDLDPVTYHLDQLARRLGGVYDGWGCPTATLPRD